MEGKNSLVELLLSDEERRKGLIIHRDTYGNNALHLAAYVKDKKLAKILITSGVDINATNNVI